MVGVAAVTEESDEKAAIIFDDVELGVHGDTEARAKIFGLLHRRNGERGVLGLHAIVISHHDRLLRLEVVVAGAERQPRGFRNVAHGGRLESFFPEELEGGGQDVLASGVALGGFGWSGHCLNVFKCKLWARIASSEKETQGPSLLTVLAL